MKLSIKQQKSDKEWKTLSIKDNVNFIRRYKKPILSFRAMVKG